MNRTVFSFTMALATLALFAATTLGCQPRNAEAESGVETPSELTQAAQVAQEAPESMPSDHGHMEMDGAEGMVELTAEGAQFDPPVSVDQIPDGAWMCLMGTVHYASLEQGDGSCPVCGMHLTQKTSGEAEETDHQH